MTKTTDKAPRILGLRDEAGGAEQVASFLRQQGYTGELAASAEQALAISREREFDLAVFPIPQAKAEDFRLLRQFRSAFSSWTLPIIVAGGLGHGQDMVEALHRGANDFAVGVGRHPELLAARIRLVLGRRALARSLQEAEQEERRSLFQARFLAMITHELRTPLTIILSSAELLKFQADPTNQPQAEKYYSRIREAARHMTTLLSDALRLSKSQSGAPPSHPSPVDLVALGKRLIADFQLSTKSRNPLSLTVEGETRPLMVDPDLLTAALYNLLSNAVKYSAQGSPVEVQIEFSGSQAVIRVIDHGIGVPERDRGHIFQPFHRARNVEGFPGIGLGLASVKEFVELEGGRVSLTSEQGRGTTVTVTLPVVAEDAKR